MSKTNPMDGKTYLRALTYALLAVPTDDEKSALQHITYIENRIVGSDGHRRHDPRLTATFDEPIAVARISAQELVLALEYAHKVSKRKTGAFSVTHDGDEVRIDYGARHPLVHPLSVVDTKSFPKNPNEWVPQDAPLNPGGLGHLDCGHVKDAMSWWKSWDKDLGTCEVRGGQDGGPTRIDITCGGVRVATAFVLPYDHPSAEIREVLPMESMWNGNGPAPRGSSNLDLDLTGDGAPAPEPLIIKIGENEINVTGLPGGMSLLCAGPCDHRDTPTPCLPCTIAAVDSAKQLVLDEDEQKGKKKKGRKAKREATTPLAPDDGPAVEA